MDYKHYSPEENKAVLAWDPDFTKLTPEESRALQEAEESGFVSEKDIDWSAIGR